MVFSERQFKKEKKELIVRLNNAEAQFDNQILDFSKYKDVSKTVVSVTNIIQQLINIVHRRKNSLKVCKRNVKLLENLDEELLDLHAMDDKFNSRYQTFLNDAGSRINQSNSHLSYDTHKPANDPKIDEKSRRSISSSTSSKSRMLREKEYELKRIELEAKKLELEEKRMQAEFEYKSALSQSGSSRQSKSNMDEVSVTKSTNNQFLPSLKPSKSVQFQNTFSAIPPVYDAFGKANTLRGDKTVTRRSSEPYGPAATSSTVKLEHKDSVNFVPNMSFFGDRVKVEPTVSAIEKDLSEFSSFLHKYDDDNTTPKRVVDNASHQQKSTPLNTVNGGYQPQGGANVSSTMPYSANTNRVEDSLPINSNANAQSDSISKIVRACLEKTPEKSSVATILNILILLNGLRTII